MGKKWKKRFNRQQNDEEFQNFQKPKGDVHSRLGWKKGPKKNYQNDRNKQLRQAFELADDVEMKHNGSSSSKSSGNLLRSGWHRVNMPHAAKYSKEIVLNALANALSARSIVLAPICFKLQGPHYSFFVESPTSAAAIKALDKQITLSPNDAFILNIRVSPSPAPQMTMNEETIAILKTVMSQRFNVDTCHLNLSHFHADPAFIQQGVYVPLSRSSVISNVIKIINENVSHLVSLDVSNNKLPTLDCFSNFNTPNLKSVNLDDNRLEMGQLEKLSRLKLVEISLKGNPSLRNFDSDEEVRDKIISQIRKLFPSLQILNGTVLPKKLSFEDDDTVEAGFVFPPSLKKNVTNDLTVNDLVLQFIRAYYAIYDSDNRESLLQAYHEEARFSMSSAYPPGQSAHGSAKLEEYLIEARNLRNIKKKSRRDKMLKQDRIGVVALLNSLPRTNHNLNSFTIDIPFYSPNLITFTLTGLFKERDGTSFPVRYFNRMFVVVRQNMTLTIVNDIMFVTMASQDQIQSINSEEDQSAAGPTGPSMSEIVKLVENLSQATGMNQFWSRKCLEETSWNYDLALGAFQEAFKHSKIPPEAFHK